MMIKVLYWTVRIVIIACYGLLSGLVIYFPLAYVATRYISPVWRQYPFVKHMMIKDSILYAFAIVMLCTFLQMLENLFVKRIRGDSSV